MKKTATKFICDECNKESDFISEGFPYKQNWRYLFKLEIKVDEKDIREVRDKHFCTKKCLIKYISGIRKYSTETKREY